MNRKLMFVLFLSFAVLLVGCNGNVPTASVTNTPTVPEPTTGGELVESTAVPSPTPTLEPTDTPTAVPTDSPTATPAPSVWEIAETMLKECVESPDSGTTGSTPEAFEAYFGQLLDGVVSKYPVINDPRWAVFGVDTVLVNDGTAPGPFDLDYTSGPAHNVDAGCGVYVIFIEDVPENRDGDGILVGEAYLFYEVGGTQPNVLDGELKEVHFFFPSVP